MLLSDRCQEVALQADSRHPSSHSKQTEQTQTGAVPAPLSCHWLVIDPDRPVIGPDSSVNHRESWEDSPLLCPAVGWISYLKHAI